MKRTLLFTMLIGLSVSVVFSQTQSNVLKTRNKNTGAHSTSFTPVVVNGRQMLKSARVNSPANPYKNVGIKPFNVQNVTGDKKIIIGQDSVTPIFIERKTSNLKSAVALSPKEKCFTFLKSIQQDMHIADAVQSFNVTDIQKDELGQQHIRLSQKYHGIKVYDADFYVHLTDQREIMNGRYFIINRDVDTIPGVSWRNALQLVQNDLQKVSPILELTPEQHNLLHYSGPTVDTVILDNKKNFNQYSLAYVVTIRPNFRDEWIYFVDAMNGSIVHKYNNTKYDGPVTANATDLNGVSRTINTYLEKGTYYMIDIAEPMFNATTGEGLIRTLDAQNTSASNLKYVDVTSGNNTWTKPAAVSAHYNASQTYKYFKNTFGRNSINGQGGNIISLINVTEKDGSSMENAFWNGAAIFYGNGGTYFSPLAAALDVAAHEIGHGVTGNTAALEYQGQSGAMNEAFSDIFGAMVDRSNWYIGETVTKTSFISTGRLRDMSDPHNGNGNGWQPKHVSEMYTGTDDNGGVHTNSGIINYAYYLYATAVTKDKAEQVFYRALTHYLTKSSQFLDLRLAVIQSAKDLYGDNTNEMNQAKTAFDAVGIYQEQPVDTTQTYPVNPGQDYLLMENTDTNDPNTLYRSSVTATNFVGLSTTKMKRRASVVDDGSGAVFVSDDDKIRAITLGSSPAEDIISNDAFWDNAAISKDGNRLAAISTYQDTSIYVYDFNTSKWTRFMLYNPTTQEGVKSGGVLYADAIEFDHTGEYLIYDAYNSLTSNSGSSINYWDIGIIKVWDNKTQTFGDGSIAKLYGSLPDSVSIGNPTFSKNSPNIIAFDYLNERTNEYAILGLDLQTMNLGGIALNNTIGFPSYSKLDDKIAFSALDGTNQPVINEVTLDANKYSASTSPITIITQAQWPVYYATGTRVLGLSPIANFSASYISGNAPLSVKFTDNSLNEPTSWNWTFEGGTPATSTLQNPSVTYNSQGTYAVTLKVTNSYGNNTMVKSGYIVVSQATGVKDVTSSFLIYPNPVTDVLHLIHTNASVQNIKVQIYTLEGRVVKIASVQNSIDLSDLPVGMYILRIEAGSDVIQRKIMKE